MSVAWLALLLAVISFSGGNILAQWSHAFASQRKLMVLAGSIASQIASIALFSIALTRIPLAIAYPVAVGGNVALVTFIGTAVFGDRLSRWHVVGLLSICIGMALIYGGEQAQQQLAAAMPLAVH